MKNNSQKHRHINIPAVILTGILFLFALLCVMNEWKIEFTLNGSAITTMNINEEYKDSGAKATAHGTTLFFLKKDLDISTKGKVDTSTAGEYIITYEAKSGKKHMERKRKVFVQDSSSLSIQLIVNEDSYTPYNHPYEEEGFVCVDSMDGDISDNVKSIEQNGYVYYSVVNSRGEIARAERKIVYDDRAAPIITLEGGDDLNVIKDSEYVDSYSAYDEVDGDVTDKVIVEGSVDTSANGDYTLTYSCSDSHNNTNTITRTVHVIDQPKNKTTAKESPYVIYLTFDDGPGQYTDRLLDILAKYNVKATFFTTSAYPNYASCIAREAKDGHTVAVHSATHNYASIYSSEDTYWADFNKQNDVVETETGKRTTLFRFPGGSSNTVSKNYKNGIMTNLANQAASYGYTYFDWNVSSGDAGATTDTNTVYNNVITQIAANTSAGNPSVVLQHDVKDFSINAVEDIILWGLENGYSFQALTSNSYTAHHGINN